MIKTQVNIPIIVERIIGSPKREKAHLNGEIKNFSKKLLDSIIKN